MPSRSISWSVQACDGLVSASLVQYWNLDTRYSLASLRREVAERLSPIASRTPSIDRSVIAPCVSPLLTESVSLRRKTIQGMIFFAS